MDEEVSDAGVVKEATKENWDLDGVMPAAEANASGLRGKFRGLQTECRTVIRKVRTGLVDVAPMAKRSITLE